MRTNGINVKHSKSASYNSENAKKYKDSIVNNTYYLGYKDIPSLVAKYVRGKRAIDYGCGTGRSTRFLKSLGLETIGIDNSKEMLEEAIKIDSENQYIFVEDNKIPVPDEYCNLIFYCLVLCVIKTKDEINKLLEEAYRCLKKSGVAIVVTASNDFYTQKWLSYDVDFPENRNLKSGDKAKLYLKDIDVELTNFYWTHEDYCNMASSADFEVIETLLPLGSDEDEQKWVAETTIAPYAVYVLKKN